jgi:hypothetical protein
MEEAKLARGILASVVLAVVCVGIASLRISRTRGSPAGALLSRVVNKTPMPTGTTSKGKSLAERRADAGPAWLRPAKGLSLAGTSRRGTCLRQR